MTPEWTDEQAREAFVRYGDERHLVGRALLTLEQERDALQRMWQTEANEFQRVSADYKTALRERDELTQECEDAAKRLAWGTEEIGKVRAERDAARRESEALRPVVEALDEATSYLRGGSIVGRPAEGESPVKMLADRCHAVLATYRAVLASLPDTAQVTTEKEGA